MSAWTWNDVQWDGFCALLEEAWPGEFDEHARTSWRVLLDPLEPERMVSALRQLLLEGRRFRPSVSELLAAARTDPSRPTFHEAFTLIYGPRGILRARSKRPGAAVVYASEADRQAQQNDAARERASEMHPLVAAFVERQGFDRLRTLPVDDEMWGEKHRRDLERAWDAHVEAFDGREIAVLASSGRGELTHFDPLAALGIARPRELERGSA